MAVTSPPSGPSAAVPDGWKGILASGETILWQGRPDGRFVVTPTDLLSGAFGFFFAGFALFWMMMASQAGGFFWMFGLLHFAIGIGVMVGGPVRSMFVRRRSWYTLTNRRAIIASVLPLVGRRLESYRITSATPLTLVEHGAVSSVIFSEKRGWSWGRNAHRTTPIGFERIAEGRDVLGLMQQLQKEETP